MVARNVTCNLIFLFFSYNKLTNVTEWWMFFFFFSEGVDDDDPVPVILVDPSGREECVNSLLVGKGVAWFVKPPDDPISDELRHLDDWDPAAEDFLSERNSYDVEVDDVGVAIVGVKVKDESNICKFFRKRSGCSRGERCPFRHVAPQPGTYTQDQVKVYVDTENELSITLPEEGRWVGVQIRAIYSPHCFYINLPWGNRYLTEAASLNPETQGDEVNSEMDLTDLVHFMTTHYNSCQFKGNKMLLPAIGEIVAARFTCDDKWYRAKVIFSENEKNVKVFYLDFGNAEVLSMARIHPIEPQFLQLPFQAIECTLKGVEPVSGQSIWTDDAIRCFSDLVLEKSLIAFVSKRFVDMTRLELSLFDPSRSCGCIVKALCAAGYSQPVMARNKETKS
ncbi:tudor domain-containing protein 1-like [Liolophura sinensis]|uniref:tudor domain-containing protein 1-like n=1 Tax=Liolophura sinensis TaxID=3198878 RepID=UPI003158BFEF